MSLLCSNSLVTDGATANSSAWTSMRFVVASTGAAVSPRLTAATAFSSAFSKPFAACIAWARARTRDSFGASSGGGGELEGSRNDPGRTQQPHQSAPCAL
ncbi:hypothetical protein Vafri_9939 [Volvox africanus]|uniref:Uncharacterized protein n=1 Tax=Volvox africanus TaxID=51714 RepID=A0A8J4B611_9CHLO|nr:hypothetical protein Vafri_9939 [Volvox africanus]